MLRTVEQVIIDEIHDLAADKRGMHLSISLERLEHLCGRPVQRIGVSATMKPMERVASFLGGWEEAASGSAAAEGAAGARAPRPVTIIESGMNKTFDVLVTMPEFKSAAMKRADVWTPIANRLFQLMEGSRTVLIFVNNRRHCERMTLILNEQAGREIALAHHGSVSREKRLEAERALKEQAIRCLVATSSLELGIDVGHVDLVIQIDSPQSAASGIQRIGRAGHSVGDVSRGVIVVRNRGQLAECAVLAREITARRIENIHIPNGSLDVLCQQVTAIVAVEEWEVGALYRRIIRSDSFRQLGEDQFREALQVLSGFYPHCRPALEWDRKAGVLRALRHTSITALTGAGTIPQSSSYPVHHAETKVHLGELDEEYIHESRVGDVFQLGTASYRIRSIKGDRVYASEAPANAYGEVPFWRGDGPGRSYELSNKIGAFMRELEERCRSGHASALAPWLCAEYRLDGQAADSLAGLAASQMSVSAMPTDKRIVIEHYEDDAGKHHLVIHSLFGRKVNRTWMLALQRYLDGRVSGRIHASARDNGIEFIFKEWEPAFARIAWNVDGDRAEELVAESIPSSPLFGIAFRHLAETSLLLSRGFTRIPAWKQRLRSESLLQDSLPYAEQFPFVREALRISLHEGLEMDKVKRLLELVRSGEIETVVRHTAYPSPFASQFVWEFVNVQMYESDAVSKHLQYQLLSVSKRLAGQLFGATAFQSLMDADEAQAWIDGGFGGSAAAEGEAGTGTETGTETDSELAMDASSAEERLLRLLKRQGDLTERELVNRLGNKQLAEHALQKLSEREAVCRIAIGGEYRYICADEADIYAAFPADPRAASFVLRRYAERQVALTEKQLAAMYSIAEADAASWIDSWTQDGLVEPSPFAESPDDRIWTSRSAAARLLRFSIGQMRRRSEPAGQDRLCALLLRLQHVAPDSRLSGIDGLRQAIALLQGIFLPVAYWEASVFPARVADYKKDMLDLLCASGDVIWFGRKDEEEKEGKIAFFLTESKELYAPLLRAAGPSAEPELLALLRAKGASFLTSLSRDIGLPPSELMEKLLRLVWEGRVSNDQFAPIRLHGQGTVGKTPSKRGFQSGLGRWYAATNADTDSDAAGVKASLPSGDSDKAAVAWIHHLIQCFGIITRDQAAKAVNGIADRLPETIRRLEDWGMLVRGQWVEGIPYMQLSTTDQVERLKERSSAAADETIVLSSIDPANPYGALLKWPEHPTAAFARKPGNYLVFRNGQWALWVENNGKRFVTMNRAALSGEKAEFEAALSVTIRAMLRHSGARKIVVERWDGEAASLTEAAEAFRGIGAETDRNAFVLWPSSIRTN